MAFVDNPLADLVLLGTLTFSPANRETCNPSHLFRCQVQVSAAGGTEAARAARRISEIAFFPLDGVVGGDDQLCDAVAFVDDVIGLAEVEHHHANFAAVAG